MRIDKQMMINDISKCIDTYRSFVFVQENDVASFNSIKIKSIAREFGGEVLYRAFPKRIFSKVFDAHKKVDLGLSKGGISVICISDKIDAAEVISKFVKFNEEANKGVKAANKKTYINVIAGLIDDEFFGIDRADVLVKLPTLSDIRSNIMSMIVSPTANICSMLGEKINTSN